MRMRQDSDQTMMIAQLRKNNLLPPAGEEKVHQRARLLTLIFIYYFKNILSISDIQSILNPITDKYFGKDGSYSLEDIYREVFGLHRASGDTKSHERPRQEVQHLVSDIPGCCP